MLVSDGENDSDYKLPGKIAGYAMFITDADGIVINWNKDAGLLFGYKQQEIVGKSIHTLYTTEAAAQNEPAKDLQQAFVFANYRTEGWRVKKDGSLFWADVNYTALFDEDNKLSGYIKITREVKNKKNSDNKVLFEGEVLYSKQLIGNDSRFRKLIENSYEGVSLLDENLNVIYRSSSAKRIGGWENKERIKRSMLDLVHEDDQKNVITHLTEVFQNPGQSRTIAYQSKHFGGHYIWLESVFTNFLNDPEINAIVCNFRDITEEVKAKEMLQANERYFKALVENNTDAIIVFNAAKKPVYISPAHYRLMGYTLNELETLDPFSIIHPGDAELVKNKIHECFNNPGIPVQLEYRIKNRAGLWLNIESKLTNLLDDHDVQGVVNNFRNVSEKKENELKLIESEEKYKLLFKGSPLPKIFWDFETLQIIDCNEAAVNKYGFSSEEFLKLKIRDLRLPEDMVFFDEQVKTELFKNKTHKGFAKHKKKDSTVMLLEITSNLITYSDNTVVISIGNDITESRYYHDLEKLEKEILELNAWSDKTLNEAIEIYLKGIEALHPGMICSVLEKKGNKLYSMASPNLPRSYQEAISGLGVADNNGSCGTAAFLKQTVVVSDIQHDVRWKNFKEIAAAYDLAACWSHPIMNTSGEVMATFASYYKTAKKPTELEKNTIQRAVYILQVILESYNREQALRLSNERFEYVTEATSDIIWDWDLRTNNVYYSKNMTKLLGHPSGINCDNLPFYFEQVHPEDRARVVLYPEQVKYGTMVNWTEEYRFKKADGEYAFLCDRGLVIRDENGLGIRMVGAMHDITKQKQEEQHLKLLESVVTHANDSVLITEAEPFEEPGPRILYVNEAFTKMTGYLPEEVIGKSPRILQGPKTDQNELKRLSAALRKWETTEVTILNYKKNGEEFWLNFTVIPVADETGWYTHWISLERDVTQQKNEELQNQIIKEVSLIFSQNNMLNACLQETMHALGKLSDFGVTQFWLIDADKKSVNLAASSVSSERLRLFNEESYQYNGIIQGEGFVGKAWETKQMQYWNYNDNTVWPKRVNEIKRSGIKRAYSFPLIYNSDVMGILLILTDKDTPPNLGLLDNFENFTKVFATEVKRKQAEDELNQVFNFVPDILCIINEAGYFIKINPAMCSLLEYEEEELRSKPFLTFVHPDDLVKTKTEFRNIYEKTPSTYSENRYLTKSGKMKWLAWTNSLMHENGLVYCVGRNITEKKELESLLLNATTIARIGGWEVDLINHVVTWSAITREIHEVEIGYEPKFDAVIHFYKEGKSKETFRKIMEHTVAVGETSNAELEIITAKGNVKWIRIIAEAEFRNGQCVRLYGSFQDIDARKKAELALEFSLTEKREILESIGDAFFAVDKNWTVTYWNNMAASLTDMPLNQVLGTNIWDAFPNALGSVSYKNYHLAIETNEIREFEQFYAHNDKWFGISVYPSNQGLSVYFKDITERKLSDKVLRELNESLQKQARELAISNAELEQFAYVASHDLQEPLRMVTSFMTQIERKYNDLLDDKGKQYIHFAVDGAQRMRQIILDLLDFSRVGRYNEAKETVNLNETINEVIALYRKKITEKHARITFSNLPVITAYKTPLRTVLQNLISNGLKYQKAGNPPVIAISCREDRDEWLIAVKDNGIGIDPAYFDKIFIIFQRLHNKDEYSGTGMGLAVTKKIVENLGGKIWVESEEGNGATFYFTILKDEFGI